MKSVAWPFLVSRNRTVDYGTVVIPEHLSRSRLMLELPRVVDVELTEHVAYASVSVEGRPLTLGYRVVRAEQDGCAFADSVGRAIHWIEGVILQGEGRRLADESAVFARVREGLLPHYLAFWGGASAPLFSAQLSVDIRTGASSMARPVDAGVDGRIPPLGAAQRALLSFWRLVASVSVLMAVAYGFWLMCAEAVPRPPDRRALGRGAAAELSSRLQALEVRKRPPLPPTEEAVDPTLDVELQQVDPLMDASLPEHQRRQMQPFTGASEPLPAVDDSGPADSTTEAAAQRAGEPDGPR